MVSIPHHTKVAKITGNYRWVQGAHFNHEYYEGKHASLTWQLLRPLGLLRFECDRVLLSGEAVPGAIIATSSAYFSSLAAAQAAAAAAGRQLATDIPAYTSIRPELHLSEVWVSSPSDA
jgi:uncharacterized protein (TIGR02118 family)